MTALLDVQDLQVSFKKGGRFLPVVEGVSFAVNPGETLGIVGESGCGKSVTSLAVMGLLPKVIARREGKIRFDGKDLMQLDKEDYSRIRGKDLAMIFQDPMTSLNPVFTIGNQMVEAIREHTGFTKKQGFDLGLEVLNKVGIPRAAGIMKEFPHQLSGGMRQRVMIAMAMACSPKLLIADEPTTALDVTIQAQILDLMFQLKEEFKMAIILITHDMGVVAELCNRVMVMYAGKTVEEGDVAEIFRAPKHRYTTGLMNSIPSLNQGKSRLYSIPGTVPPPEEMPLGCRFVPRCDQASTNCQGQPPPRIKVGPSHFTNCWLYDELKEVRGGSLKE